MEWLSRAGHRVVGLVTGVFPPTVVLSTLPPRQALNRLRRMAHHGEILGGWMVPRSIHTSPWFIVVNSDAGGSLGLSICRAEKDRHSWTNMRVHAESAEQGGSRVSTEPRYGRSVVVQTLGGIAGVAALGLFDLLQLVIGRSDVVSLIVPIVFAAFVLSAVAYLRWVARDRIRLMIRWVTANQPAADVSGVGETDPAH